MIDLAIASNTNERLALTVFQAMEHGTLLNRLTDLCQRDFIWANSGLPTLQGVDAIIEFFQQGGFRQEIPILTTQTHFSADVIHIASSGNAVLTERIDHHWDAQGRDLMTPHIAGVIEIEQGKITALRDFYDVNCYQQSPTQVQQEFTHEAFSHAIKS